MNTTFFINGGIGRVINAIPALEKYKKLNPHDNFKILVSGWDQVFWSNNQLQSKAFNSFSKGVFEFVVKENNVVCPEPYFLNDFYNQKCNLVEAFDKIINNTNDHKDLNYNCLYLSDIEKNKFKEYVDKLKKEKNKEKLVVFQPFGSSAQVVNTQIVDDTNRSLKFKDYFKILNEISKDAVVVNISDLHLRNSVDTISIPIEESNTYIRTIMGLIYHCDYYVGICSVGQHIARTFDKPGLIIMGGTSEKNFSYQDFFDIYRKKDSVPKYTPWRICDVDVDFSNRSNDGLMNFTEDEVQEIVAIIKKNIETNKPTIKTNIANEFLNGGIYE